MKRKFFPVESPGEIDYNLTSKDPNAVSTGGSMPCFKNEASTVEKEKLQEDLEKITVESIANKIVKSGIDIELFIIALDKKVSGFINTP